MYDTAYAISVMNVYLQPSMNWHGFYDLILVSIKVIIRKGGQRLSVYSHEVFKKCHTINMTIRKIILIFHWKIVDGNSDSFQKYISSYLWHTSSNIKQSEI